MTALGILRPSDFFSQPNSIVAKCIFSMHARDVAVDEVTLIDELKKDGNLNKVGGELFIAGIFDSAVTAANVEHHARIVLEKSRLRRLRSLSRDIDELVGSGKESTEISGAVEERVFQLGRGPDQTEYREMSEILNDVLADIESRLGERKSVPGIPTGFIELDRMTFGLQPGELSLLAARPSVGKTAMAMNIAEYAAQQGYGVAVVSLEMKDRSLIERVLVGAGRMDNQKVRGGFLSADDVTSLVETSARLSSLDIRIDHGRQQTALTIRSKARRIMYERPFHLLIIDYVQLIESSGQVESRAQEVGVITRVLRALAQELNIAVLLLSQIKRPGHGQERTPPRLSDLKESGSLEEHADMVMLMHRPELNEVKPEAKARWEGVAEIQVAKQRNGPTGTITLHFQKRFARFENLAKDHQEDIWGD